MTNHATGDTVADVVNRPPLGVVLVAVAVIALGEASGAVIGAVRPAVARWAAARIAERPQAHGLTGSAEYDDEVRDRAVFATEAGLSFLHTHAEGLGLVAFFSGRPLKLGAVALLVPLGSVAGRVQTARLPRQGRPLVVQESQERGGLVGRKGRLRTAVLVDVGHWGVSLGAQPNGQPKHLQRQFILSG